MLKILYHNWEKSLTFAFFFWEGTDHDVTDLAEGVEQLAGAGARKTI